MSTNPLVSAIIIFLNEEKFIEEAIQSVFAQTYSNWELLLVDDGSTDKSTQTARLYAERYPGTVRYLEHDGHENRGMSASRNLGVERAAGKYISYLDGDDVWLSNKLERQVAILESNPEAVMTYGPLHRWFSFNGNPDDIYREDLFGAGRKGVHPFRDTLVEPPKLLTLFLPDGYFIPGGIMIRKQVIENVGGYEEDFRGMYEDTVLMVKVCLTSKVFVSGDVLYKYRMHPDACTHVCSRKGESRIAEAAYLDWVQQYLSSQNITDPHVWQALRDGQWRCGHALLYRLLDYRRHVEQLEVLAVNVGRWTMPKSLRHWLWTQWHPPV